MKYVLDTHCHTLASGHAYSTIGELVDVAKEKGLELIAITEHGPDMPGAPHFYYFGNLKVVPPIIKGVKILKGIEANIIDYDGNVDLNSKRLKKLDIVLASLHEICLKPGSMDENTKAVIGAMNNPLIDIIAHPGNPQYTLDFDLIVEEAAKTNTLIEINNSSFVSSRRGSYENCLYIIRRCKELNIPISLGSDTHYADDVGDFSKAVKLVKEVNFPEELIINTSVDKLLNYLREKGKQPLRDVRADIEGMNTL
jgi:putative hydrolase